MPIKKEEDVEINNSRPTLKTLSRPGLKSEEKNRLLRGRVYDAISYANIVQDIYNEAGCNSTRALEAQYHVRL